MKTFEKLSTLYFDSFRKKEKDGISQCEILAQTRLHTFWKYERTIRLTFKKRKGIKDV